MSRREAHTEGQGGEERGDKGCEKHLDWWVDTGKGECIVSEVDSVD